MPPTDGTTLILLCIRNNVGKKIGLVSIIVLLYLLLRLGSSKHRGEDLFPKNPPRDVGLLEWQLVLSVSQDGRPLSPAEPGVIFLDLPGDVLLVDFPAVGFLLPAPAVASTIFIEELAGAARLTTLDNVVEEKLVLVDCDVRVAAFREVDPDGRGVQAGGGAGTWGGLTALYCCSSQVTRPWDLGSLQHHRNGEESLGCSTTNNIKHILLAPGTRRQ